MCAVASRSLSSSIAAPSYPQNANRYIGSKMLSRLAHSVWKLPKISHLIQVFIDSIVVLLLPQLRISSYDPLFGTRKCDFFTNFQPLYNRVTLEGKVVTCNLANGINSNGKSTHSKKRVACVNFAHTIAFQICCFAVCICTFELYFYVRSKEELEDEGVGGLIFMAVKRKGLAR